MTIVSSPLRRPTANPSRGGSTVLFPWKLHEMLKSCTAKDKENIASWVSNGRAFRVHDIRTFVSEILPLFFNQTKYKSFQRQLNLWGFQRVQSGPQRGAYSHNFFLREEPTLCSRLTRQKSKKLVPTDSPKPTKFTTMHREPSNSGQGWPLPPKKFGNMVRQVSEGSLKNVGKPNTAFVGKQNSTSNDSWDIADFDGATFHLLEQERYDELDHEFESSVRPENQVRNSGLLKELELGLFGIPKMELESY